MKDFYESLDNVGEKDYDFSIWTSTEVAQAICATYKSEAFPSQEHISAAFNSFLKFEIGNHVESLAQALGVNPSVIAGVRDGVKRTSLEVLVKFCYLSGISLIDLFYGTSTLRLNGVPQEQVTLIIQHQRRAHLDFDWIKSQLDLLLADRTLWLPPVCVLCVRLKCSKDALKKHFPHQYAEIVARRKQYRQKLALRKK